MSAGLSPAGMAASFAALAQRHRELYHLVHGPRIDPKPTGRCRLAQALNPNRTAYLRVEEFATLRRLLEARMGKQRKLSLCRSYV